MADRELNIKVKATGTDKTGRDIKNVGKAAKGFGSEVEGVGGKAKRMAARLGEGLKSLIVGPLSFAALGAAGVAAIRRIITVQDEAKRQLDENIKAVQQLRQAYDGLFEALGAFDESGRENIVKNVTLLAARTGVQMDLARPVVEEYQRQFGADLTGGRLSSQQYLQGVEGMLGYAQRHGGTATTDLIQLMAGFGMRTPDSQGVFRRQIADAAGSVGLRDEDVIRGLARSNAVIKAMGWIPSQAIENIAVIARNESGRLKQSLPYTTFQSLLSPGEQALADYRVPSGLRDDPQLVYGWAIGQQQKMDRKDYVRMLTAFYGEGAASGVYKLATADRGAIGGVLTRAAGRAGIEAEAAEENARMGTLEAVGAKSEALQQWLSLPASEKEKYMKMVRGIGQTYSEKRLKVNEPFSQWLREVWLPESEEKEYGAYRAWWDSLSAGERKSILNVARPGWQQGDLSQSLISRNYWEQLTPQEQWDYLQKTLPNPNPQLNQEPGVVNYNQNTIFQIGTQGDPYALPPGSMKPDSNTEF